MAQTLSATCDPKELISLIKTRFVRPDGLLARTYPVGKFTIYDNFDDVVPFFLFFGEADFLLEQIRIIRKNSENFVTLCGQNGVIATSIVDEWFGGLHSLWKHTGDAETFKLLSESVDFVRKSILKDNYLAAAYYPRKNKSARYYEPWSSGILETFCETREEFPDLFEAAQRVLSSWTNDAYFQKYGIFPYRVFRNRPKQWIHRHVLSRRKPKHQHTRPPYADAETFKDTARHALIRARFELTPGFYSQMMKSNSTPAFSLLEFYRATGDSKWLELLSRWIAGARAHFVREGDSGSAKVYSESYPNLGEVKESSSVPGFILVDVLCDAAAFAPGFGEHLPLAKRILDTYWNDRLPSGLVAFSEFGRFSHLDVQIDFSVALRRYGELSGDASYIERAKQLTETAFARHFTPDGYITYLGSSKKPVVVDPKYNALALKGMINLTTFDKKIYPEMYSLFKDR